MINHSTRNKGVGGSELAAVLGLSIYETPYDVWLRKTGQSEPVTDNQYMKRGRMLEPLIAQLLEEELQKEFSDVAICTVDEFYDVFPITANEIEGIRSYDDGVGTDTIFSKDYDFCFSSPDRFLSVNGVWCGAELKSVNNPKIKTVDDVTQNHLTWIFQAQYCMMVTGLRSWYIAWVSEFNLELHHIRIDYDSDIAAEVFKQVAAFWEYVVTQTPPPPINADDVIRMYPNPQGTIEAVDELYSVIQDYAAAKQVAKQAEDKAQALKDIIAVAVGDAAIITYGGQKVATFKQQSTTRLDMELLKHDYPNIMETYSKKTITRVLRTTKEK